MIKKLFSFGMLCSILFNSLSIEAIHSTSLHQDHEFLAEIASKKAEYEKLKTNVDADMTEEEQEALLEKLEHLDVFFTEANELLTRMTQSRTKSYLTLKRAAIVASLAGAIGAGLYGIKKYTGI